ncbi:MAG TPA: DUF4367 domain-containing protein [Patescibacteria group bacterium]|nr:DUF4367 domain-containing protein [Patescibacteria group bacterium]
MTENVIELNGKRYDAVTGAYLGISHTLPVPAAVPVAARGRVIDGFIRPTAVTAHTSKQARPVKPLQHKPQPIVAQPITAEKTVLQQHDAPKKQRQNPITIIPAKAHQPERAKTLMRRAVHKPENSLKPVIKPHAPAEVPAKPISAIAPKRSALQVDPERMERAKTVDKHSNIKRFQPTRSDYTAPEAATHTVRHIPAVTVKPAPIAPTRQQHTDIFEAAIANAESHKQPEHKRTHHRSKVHRRLINTMAGIAAFLVIGGFVAYLNMPNIQLQYASVKAGFKAEIPSYKPTGYALRGGAQRIGDTVSLQFRSGENNFTLTQQPSTWNSQTLVDNTLALSNGAYRTIESAGRTVYIYDNNNAVWVNNGIRYDISGNTSLSTDDISRLASSL